MKLIMISAAAALTAAAVGLLIKKSNPELSMLLGAAAAAVILLSAMSFAESVKELGETVRRICSGSGTLVAPVLKCLGVSVITKISSELCRDSSQAAAAAALELAGTLCALSIAMPTLMSVLELIGSFV